MDDPASGRTLKDEFQPLKFGLGYPDPDVFVRSQWQLPRWFYVIWRLFWFLWHIGWIIGSGINSRINNARYPEEGAKWFLYLTNTTLLLTTITTTLDFVIIFYVTALRGGTVIGLPGNVKKNDTDNSSSSSDASITEKIVFKGEFTLIEGVKQHTTTWYLKLVWLLYNIIGSSNIVVTLLYWTVVFKGSTDVIGVEVHSINTVFIVLNLLVTAMPVQLLHFIYPMAYAAVYILFNCIYLISGGTDLQGNNFIYAVLDWNKPFPTAVVVVLGILVATPLGHLLVFAIYTFRMFIHSKINSASYSLKGKFRRNQRTVAVADTPEGRGNMEMAVSASD